jgi:hypothetical protein
VLLGFLIALVYFATLWLMGQHDRSTYQIQLDHGGLSEDALIFNAKSNLNMQQLVKKLSQRNYDNYQVQFIDPAQEQVSYIYAKHPKTNISMISGRNFNTSDYNSPLPFAIVGQDWVDNLYKPQVQAYLFDHERYVAVIGQVGTSGESSLNTHRFISVSPLQTTNPTPIKNLEVIADGTLVKQHRQAFSKLVQAKRASTYVPKQDDQQQAKHWSSRIILWALYGGTFVLMSLLTLLFYGTFRPALKSSELDMTLDRKMKWGYLRQFSLYLLVSGAIGYFVGLWQTYLISYELTTYYMIGLAGYAVILMGILLFTTKGKPTPFAS